MGLFNFGKKRKERELKEKNDYIDKLIPYKEYLSNYDSLREELFTHNMEIITKNVNNVVNMFEYQKVLDEKYGKDIGQKIYSEGIFLDMNEGMFNDYFEYKRQSGNFEFYDDFRYRTERKLKTKNKVVITNTKKIKNPNKIDYIFENDKLVEIKNYG